MIINLIYSPSAGTMIRAILRGICSARELHSDAFVVLELSRKPGGTKTELLTALTGA
jgi:hypothetical protein